MPDKKVLNRTLHREIDLLKKMFIDLGSLVEDRLHKACIAIESGDKELAEDIIRTDNVIDQMEVQIEEECLKVLALHQPVASDLRLIVAIIKINNELERIGDMAVGIARRVQVIQQEAASFAVDYTAMAVKVLGMIKMSLDALLTESAGADDPTVIESVFANASGADGVREPRHGPHPGRQVGPPREHPQRPLRQRADRRRHRAQEDR